MDKMRIRHKLIRLIDKCLFGWSIHKKMRVWSDECTEQAFNEALEVLPQNYGFMIRLRHQLLIRQNKK